MALFGRREKRGEQNSFVSLAFEAGQPKAQVPRYRSSPERSLPINIVSMTEQFGRHEFDSMGSDLAAFSVWQNLVSPLATYAQTDTAGFVRELAEAVIPAGGWAVYGGARLVGELLDPKLPDPNYHVLMTHSLDFLRACGVPPLKVSGYEWQFWANNKGKVEPWLQARPTPPESQASLTRLGVDEMRRLVQLEEASDSNVIYARYGRGWYLPDHRGCTLG
jgi:hypothetical protein